MPPDFESRLLRVSLHDSRSEILTTLIGYHIADLILHFKYISQVPVIIFTPDMISVCCANQLCRNP